MNIYEFLDKNIAVFGTLTATIITSVITLYLQKSNNKNKLKEMTHQTILKLKESDYQEKRKLIVETLTFLEVLKQPSSYLLFRTPEISASSTVKFREQVAKHINQFYVDYALYKNNEVNQALEELGESLNELEQKELEIKLKPSDPETLDDRIGSECLNEARRVMDAIDSFSAILRKQVEFEL
ncbi:hypothetical protein [Pantoea sp. FN0305]|uniref:hypothetical protein n=1 Tax=Pantoea sp. FN0305 TaxID=3418559 RepID=UPI003CF9792F